MGKQFFTADWHAGEDDFTLLREESNKNLLEKWLKECHRKISSDDTLYLIGDLAISLNDLNIYKELPKCNKILILGNKEYDCEFASQKEISEKLQSINVFNQIEKNMIIECQGMKRFLAHKPEDCF